MCRFKKYVYLTYFRCNEWKYSYEKLKLSFSLPEAYSNFGPHYSKITKLLNNVFNQNHSHYLHSSEHNTLPVLIKKYTIYYNLYLAPVC